MQIEIKVDASCGETKVIVITDKITDEVNNLVKRLSVSSPQIIIGFRNENLVILEQSKIIRLYASNGKIYAVTDNGEYLLKLRLYELEDRLDKTCFVRISNSEIINLQKVKSFDLSLAGTICVKLSNNTAAYVSRRYISKIKQTLGI